MSWAFPGCPEPPEWELDWEALDQRFDWVRALRDCPQDPEYHAEGNVWIHTRMVCRALVALPAWRALDSDARNIAFAAALLHDIAKPSCSKVDEDGRITTRGHGGRGERMARLVLWRMDTPLAMREEICAIVAFHQVPFFLVDTDDGARRAIALSHRVRPHLLALVAEADARGRTCATKAQLIDNVALYLELSDEQGCRDRAFPFASDHSRFMFFRKPHRDPHHHAFDSTKATVTVMAGLPGAGKDHWIREHGRGKPVVGLDKAREVLGVRHGGKEGQVIQEAREAARKHLRAQRSFIWNATNVDRRHRRDLLGLLASYNVRVRYVYVEASEETLRERNQARRRPVPWKAVRRMIQRWSVPDATEAHEVSYVDGDGATNSATST